MPSVPLIVVQVSSVSEDEAETLSVAECSFGNIIGR